MGTYSHTGDAGGYGAAGYGSTYGSGGGGTEGYGSRSYGTIYGSGDGGGDGGEVDGYGGGDWGAGDYGIGGYYDDGGMTPSPGETIVRVGYDEEITDESIVQGAIRTDGTRTAAIGQSGPNYLGETIVEGHGSSPNPSRSHGMSACITGRTRRPRT